MQEILCVGTLHFDWGATLFAATFILFVHPFRLLPQWFDLSHQWQCPGGHAETAHIISFVWQAHILFNLKHQKWNQPEQISQQAISPNSQSLLQKHTTSSSSTEVQYCHIPLIRLIYAVLLTIKWFGLLFGWWDVPSRDFSCLIQFWIKPLLLFLLCQFSHIYINQLINQSPCQR